MFYTHGALDRVDHLRRDADRLAELRLAESTRLVPVWRGTVLVTRAADGDQPSAATLPADAHVPDGDPVFLGLVDDVTYFAISCAALDDADPVAAQATTADGQSLLAEFVDLRKAGPSVPANDGALLAYARGLVYWQETTRFCDRCGQPLISTHGGHVKRCAGAECEHLVFPRTDPAVIMLVTHGEGADARCLLGRSPAWPEGVFSTLAGFVEPGESLEQAVQREVFEEANVQTDDISYIASQPWPFPRSIMLGFEARATTTDITIDPNELADAQWFTREQLLTFGNWGDERYALQLPRTDSIARFLINRWMQSGSD